MCSMIDSQTEARQRKSNSSARPCACVAGCPLWLEKVGCRQCIISPCPARFFGTASQVPFLGLVLTIRYCSTSCGLADSRRPFTKTRMVKNVTIPNDSKAYHACQMLCTVQAAAWTYCMEIGGTPGDRVMTP